MIPIRSFCFFILLFLSICAGTAGSQELLQPGEQQVFSFHTQNNKILTIARGADNRYLVYRFGKTGRTELEYKGQLSDGKWKGFLYSGWLRGGGPGNEGIDLSYLYFTHKGYRYVVFDTYFANGNKTGLGIKVTHLGTGKTTLIQGNRKTKKGSLSDLREEPRITAGDELFD